MARLIFVNRFFHPDHSATSQLLSDLAFYLASAGHDVHIIASRQIYDDPKADLPQREAIGGVTVHRIATTAFGRSTLTGRAVDYLSFYRAVGRQLVALARPGDVIIAKTDPPLLSVIALRAARRTGARLVNWLQDIYPETAAVLGVPFIRGPVATGLAALRDRTLREAAATVVVGDAMARTVAERGAREDTIRVIPNWCDDEAIQPVAPADNPLRGAWDLGDKFVLAYSGNLGRAHEFNTVLAAAERLRGDQRFVFLMIGGGSKFNELRTITRERGLERAFRFMPYQEQSQLSRSLGAADAHWLSLNPELEGLIVPSKFYGIAAAGRPIIVIADQRGELASLVQKHGCGLAIAPGDAQALVKALDHLSQEPTTAKEMGARAREMLVAEYSRQRGLARWGDLLVRLDATEALSPAHE